MTKIIKKLYLRSQHPPLSKGSGISRRAVVARKPDPLNGALHKPQSHRRSTGKSIAPRQKNASLLSKLQSILSVPGQREVDQLIREQYRDGVNANEIKLTDEKDSQWEKRKHLVLERIQQYKASGH